MNRESDWFGDVFKIALGIALSGLILWRLSDLYVEHQLAAAQPVLNAVAQSWSSDAFRLKAVQHERDAEALDKRLADQKRVQAQFAAQWQVANDQRRKDEAWNAYYHPAPECLDSTRSDVSIQCGNAYIISGRSVSLRLRGGLE